MRASVELLSALAAGALLAPPPAAQSGETGHFLSKECNEDAIRLQSDPRPLRNIVGAAYPLVLQDGNAQVLMLVQDCSQYWWDGAAFGPTQEMHVWVAIDGLKDTRPVVGAQQTRPTMTWYAVFDGNSNQRVRDARRIAGEVRTAIDSVRLDPPAPERGGRVFWGKGLVYSWRAVSSPPAFNLMGVNHDVYTRDAAGKVALNHIQALVHVTATASQGTLTVTGNTDIFPPIRAGIHPVSVNTFFPVWVRGTLGMSPAP